MTRLPLLALIVLAFAGCDSTRTIRNGSVELAPHTYAMTTNAFNAWAYNQGHRPAYVTVFNSTSECGLFRPYTSTDDSTYAGDDLEGLTVWHPHGGTVCAIKCTDPHHLTLDDQCKLIHEEAHREDFALGSEGGSHYWHLLCLMPNGAFFLTHHEINARLRREGWLK